MEQKINKNYIILIIFIILVVGFYWFAWRPSQIRKECMNNARRAEQNISNPFLRQEGFKDLEQFYLDCLRGRGLEK